MLIVAGGGAYYVSDAFGQEYSKGFVHISQKPEFSNARGFLKYRLEMM